MRIRLYLLCIVCLGCMIPCNGQQSYSTMGTDFWFTYMEQADAYSGEITLYIYISAPRACSVTVNNPNTQWSTTAQVQPGVVTTLSVPQSQGSTLATNTVSNTGLHLVSTDTVSVYIEAQGVSSRDESIVLPTVVLRDRYMIQTYPSDRFGNVFIVMATEDSTWVDIQLTSNTDHGQNAGSTHSIFLPVAGKCYQMKTASTGVKDFSGTKVTSRDCKPIAVFQGDCCVYIPNQTQGVSCDHAMEQSIPTDYWGKQFAVTGCGSTLRPDRVRITSLYDSCHVVRNNNYLTTLMSGETHEYVLYASAGCDFISTTQPVSIGVFWQYREWYRRSFYGNNQPC